MGCIFGFLTLFVLSLHGKELNNTFQLSLVENRLQPIFGQIMDGILQERVLHSSIISTTKLYLFDETNIFQTYLNWCNDVQQGTSTFVSVSHCPNPSWLQSLAYHVEIPLISYFPSRCSQIIFNGYVLEFPEHYGNIADVLLAIIAKQKWSQVIVVYDNSVDDQHWFDQFLGGDSGLTYSLLEISDEEDLNTIMSDFYKPTEYAMPYLLLCNIENTKRILSLAKDLQLRRLEYTWIIYHEGTSRDDIMPDLLQSDNIAVIDTSNEKAEQDIINMQDLSNSLIESYSRILNESLWEIQKPFKKSCISPLPIRMRNTLLSYFKEQLEEKACNNENCTTTEYDIHSSLTQQDGNPKFVPVGAWKSDQTLESYNDLFPNAFNGFNNRTFTVVSLEYSFFQIKTPTGNGTYKWTGLTFELLDELARDLNFSYVVVEPPDGNWGLNFPNGSWNGMIGEVIAKRVDFAAACFSVIAAREVVIDYATPYFRDESVVIIKRPNNDNRLSLYLHPLKWQVWLSILTSVVVCGLLLWLITKFNPYYDQPGVRVTKSEGLALPQNALLYTFGALCQQGGAWLPVTQSGRILVGAYWFFVLVMAATYTGNLIAFLAVSTLQMPFNDLEEMAKQNEYSWGPTSAVALYMLFRDANFEPYTSVYKNIDTSPTHSAAMKRVREGNYAFIAEESYFAAEVAKDCNLAMIKETFYPTNYAWALQTNAPFKELFDNKINKLREAGILKRWVQKWMPNNLHCKGLGPETNAKVATVRDFQGAFIVLFSGIVTSITVLIIEYMYRRIYSINHLKNEMKNMDIENTSENLPNQTDDIE